MTEKIRALFHSRKLGHLYASELYNRTINNDTVMYWRYVKANFLGTTINYQLIYLVANVSDTHKIYIASVSEYLNETHYGYVFTIALYWFKDKNTFSEIE